MMQHIEETESLAMRVKKLAESQPVISTGMEYNGLYDLNNKSAEKYLRDHCRGNYLNIDTGNIIRITRKGAEKVTRHDAENIAHLKSLALIPELIRRSIYIAEEENEKNINEYDTFRYYVVGLKMAGVDYTVKLAIGVKNGYTYYDHALTPIDIKKLLRSIDEIKRPFASKESSINGEQASDVLSESAQHPYSVANSLPCRNNSDKNLANYLESAQNPRTFASVILFSYVICSFLHNLSIWLFG